MSNIRRGENKRESWWATNNSSKTVTMGDLLLVPAIKPGKRVDLLNYYSREKISHSTVLVSLVKSGIISLNKKKIYTNRFPGKIPTINIDEAVTPSEENEANAKYIALSIKTVYSNYNILLTNYTILVDTSSNDVTVTLPLSPTTGQIFNIKCIDSTNICEVSGNGKTIDGSTVNIQLIENESITVQADSNGNWWII